MFCFSQLIPTLFLSQWILNFSFKRNTLPSFSFSINSSAWSGSKCPPPAQVIKRRMCSLLMQHKANTLCFKWDEYFKSLWDTQPLQISLCFVLCLHVSFCYILLDKADVDKEEDFCSVSTDFTSVSYSACVLFSFAPSLSRSSFYTFTWRRSQWD